MWLYLKRNLPGAMSKSLSGAILINRIPGDCLTLPANWLFFGHARHFTEEQINKEQDGINETSPITLFVTVQKDYLIRGRMSFEERTRSSVQLIVGHH